MAIIFLFLFLFLYKGNFMQQNINPCYNAYPNQFPPQSPNAVNINIIQPQAYADGANGCNGKNSCYSLYGANQNSTLPLYPMNYNNFIQNGTLPSYSENSSYLAQNPIRQTLYSHQGMIPPQYQYQMPQMQAYQQQPGGYNNGVNGYGVTGVPQGQPNGLNNGINNGTMGVPQGQPNGLNNGTNAYGATNLVEKTPSGDTRNYETTYRNSEKSESSKEDKDKKPKTITLLTDNYIRSMENYMNDSDPKVRLIAAKELVERFKEDDSRAAHPSLVPLLNKALRDTSPSVRFLALTALQLGYSTGNDETVGILKEIQASNQDKLGEDAILASEILLNLSAPKLKEVK